MGKEKKGGSEWWSEEVGVAVTDWRKAFEEWLQKRDLDTYDKYSAQRAGGKHAVKISKK